MGYIFAAAAADDDDIVDLEDCPEPVLPFARNT